MASLCSSFLFLLRMAAAAAANPSMSHSAEGFIPRKRLVASRGVHSVRNTVDVQVIAAGACCG
jgi:hypothetical protein